MRARRLLLSSALLLLGVVGMRTPRRRACVRSSASERTLIPLTTKLRYTTMILLPEQEEILDVVCGDRDFWVISAAQNIAHVKPAKEGAATNLNLVTASGRVYSFLLTEQKSAQPDLKVYVTADPSVAAGPTEVLLGRRHVGAAGGVDRARGPPPTPHSSAPTRPSRASSSSIRRPCSSSTPSPKYERPFFVRSIWHDGQFTYIKADATELPALYEVKDG